MVWHECQGAQGKGDKLTQAILLGACQHTPSQAESQELQRITGKSNFVQGVFFIAHCYSLNKYAAQVA